MEVVNSTHSRRLVQSIVQNVRKSLPKDGVFLVTSHTVILVGEKSIQKEREDIIPFHKFKKMGILMLEYLRLMENRFITMMHPTLNTDLRKSCKLLASLSMNQCGQKEVHRLTILPLICLLDYSQQQDDYTELDQYNNPSEWTSYYDENSVPYWYNSLTGESTYEDPSS